MKLLRLGFTDTFGGIENFFTKILSERYEIVRDDQNPDYLIFGDKNFGGNNINYDAKNCIKVFYTGENARPWDYRCHNSISFDHFEFEGANYRLPLYVIYDYDNHFRDVPNTSTISTPIHGRNPGDLLQRKEFCSFVVKNEACAMRNNWFHRLHAYKPVASAGPLYNNTGYILPRGEQSVQAKLQFLNNHKFNLCFENSSYPGYATEKLYDALCAKTIPIYWGSPTIEVDFNTKAFLNWHDYQEDDAFFEAIKEIDENPDLYEEMYMQPMFADYQKVNKFFDKDRFLNWFDKNVYKGVLNG
jgi:hypothetical protein